ncbi:three-helix bundle dimerization domain-containing protein [Tenggerimyces flavus]|uniref:Three-helix bundle dimerization domain-containing protein n=1 Tax=Tenggerimyces flavus TaxID=1708749 RepID=A0ABV7YNT0_9ACTN|nr:hypothetical protein [Tenggerimyces flavus]MBM7786447.1 hypothetical protein [Tenggerimyces flavus]
MAHDLDEIRTDAENPDHDPIAQQLDQLKQRLVQQYAGRADVNEGVVSGLVDQAQRQFEHAKIRTYVPILVEREAHVQLGRPEPAAV